jgi:putative ABC transport system permease protein
MGVNMFRNYLKIALRNLKRHKGYSFLNIAGLAFGMACSILILLWVRDETSYDRFHVHADDICRVLQEVKFSDHETTWAITQGPLGPGLERDFPEIVRSVRIKGRRFQVRQGDLWVPEIFWLADPSLFEVFTFPLAAGDPASALTDPHSVILSEKMAAKYFPDGDVMGRTLRADDRFDFRVTGVLKAIPRNSEFPLKIGTWFSAELADGLCLSPFPIQPS